MIRKTAYILRTCKADMTSYDGFVWPREGMVEAPDWQPTEDCGHGLHGFLRGEGNGGLANCSSDAVWLVAKVEEYIDLGGKVKFPRAEVVFAGGRRDATQLIHDLCPGAAVIGITLTGGDYSTLTGRGRSTLTGGDYSTLTGGYRSTLIGGYRSTLIGGVGSALTGGGGSKLTGGDYSTLTGGYGSTLTGGDYSTLTGRGRSTLTGGDYSTLTGGYGSTLTGGDYSTLTGRGRSTLTGGDYSTLTGGYGSTLTGGYGSTLCIWWHDGCRRRLAVAYVGEDGIEPNTPYRLDDAGNFVEAT